MAAQALARVTLEEDELANASGLRAALLKTSDCVVETDTPIYSVVHVAVTPHRTAARKGLYWSCGTPLIHRFS